MRKTALALAAVGSLWLTGCAGVVSLHPMVTDTDRDAVVEPALVGFWQDATPDKAGEKATYLVARKGRAGYTITSVENGATKSATMHVLRVGERYLLDIFDNIDDPALPVHVYFGLRMNAQKNTVWLAEMRSDWLKAEIAAKGQPRNEILTEEEVKGKVVLTAPQADLRKYLLLYAADQRAFDKETELHRIK